MHELQAKHSTRYTTQSEEHFNTHNSFTKNIVNRSCGFLPLHSVLFRSSQKVHLGPGQLSVEFITTGFLRLDSSFEKQKWRAIKWSWNRIVIKQLDRKKKNQACNIAYQDGCHPVAVTHIGKEFIPMNDRVRSFPNIIHMYFPPLYSGKDEDFTFQMDSFHFVT